MPEPNNEPNTQLRSDHSGSDSVTAMLIDHSDEMDLAANVEEWQDVPFDVMLDSGCSRHVVPPSCVPGYRIQESALSRSGH